MKENGLKNGCQGLTMWLGLSSWQLFPWQWWLHYIPEWFTGCGFNLLRTASLPNSKRFELRKHSLVFCIFFFLLKTKLRPLFELSFEQNDWLQPSFDLWFERVYWSYVSESLWQSLLLVLSSGSAGLQTPLSISWAISTPKALVQRCTLFPTRWSC